MERQSLKRGREGAEEEEGRRVRRRVEQELASNRDGMIRLLRANTALTEGVLAGLEDRVEELQELVEERAREAEEKDKLLKEKNAEIKELESSLKTSEEDLDAKIANKHKKVKAMEDFEESIMENLVNPEAVEMMQIVKKQRQKIRDLQNKLNEREEKQKTNENRKTTKETGKSTLNKLKGINITLVRTNTETKLPKDNNNYEKIKDILKGKTMGVEKAKENVVCDEIKQKEVDFTKLCEENATTVTQNVSIAHDEATEMKPTDVKADVAEEELLSNDEGEKCDPFWFCGPPSEVLLNMEQKRKEKEQKKEEEKQMKMKRKRDDDDCGGCTREWVHACLEDLVLMV